MGISRRFADIHAGFTAKSQLLVCGGDQIGKVVLSHAWLEGLVDGLVCLQGGLIRQTHKFNLMRILDHSATSGRGSGAGDRHLWRSLANAIAEDKRRALLDSQAPAGEASILQPGSN